MTVPQAMAWRRASPSARSSRATQAHEAAGERVPGPGRVGEDPRWELIRQLVEYKKFKDAAGQLAVLEERQESVFPRVPSKLEFETEVSRRQEASIFDLVNAVNLVLQRFSQRTDQRDIFEDKWSVSEKIEALMRAISEKARLKFSELFGEATSRSEVVVTFLALLELIRLRQLTAVQKEPFGDVEICRATPAAEATDGERGAASAPAPDESQAEARAADTPMATLRST